MEDALNAEPVTIEALDAEAQSWATLRLARFDKDHDGQIDPAEFDAPPDDEVAGPAGPGIGSGALPWKVALEQLRERTVRRS